MSELINIQTGDNQLLDSLPRKITASQFDGGNNCWSPNTSPHRHDSTTFINQIPANQILSLPVPVRFVLRWLKCVSCGYVNSWDGSGHWRYARISPFSTATHHSFTDPPQNSLVPELYEVSISIAVSSWGLMMDMRAYLSSLLTVLWSSLLSLPVSS